MKLSASHENFFFFFLVEIFVSSCEVGFVQILLSRAPPPRHLPQWCARRVYEKRYRGLHQKNGGQMFWFFFLNEE